MKQKSWNDALTILNYYGIISQQGEETNMLYFHAKAISFRVHGALLIRFVSRMARAAI